MLSRKSVCLACAITVLTWLGPGAAFAQQPTDKRTFFTFSAPVHMPGVTLGTGTYLFRLADVNSHSLVQVLNRDGTKLFGTFFTIPALRPTAADRPEVRLMESPVSTAPPIQTWWYPGETTGFEFVYPKADARTIAKTAKQPVLTTHAQTTTAAETGTKELSRISSSGEETIVDPAAAPTSSVPIGATQQGDVAPPTLVLPSNPVPATAEPSPTVKK